LGKIFFANSSGLGWWESSGLLAKPQFPVVCVPRYSRCVFYRAHGDFNVRRVPPITTRRPTPSPCVVVPTRGDKGHVRSVAVTLLRLYLFAVCFVMHTAKELKKI
jgi:hypothetical protein